MEIPEPVLSLPVSYEHNHNPLGTYLPQWGGGGGIQKKKNSIIYEKLYI
jgi:hypothetical protein